MTAPVEVDERGAKGFRLSGQFSYILAILLLTVLLMPLSRLVSPSLGSWSTVSAILVVSSMLTLIGFGQGLVILVGELDLFRLEPVTLGLFRHQVTARYFELFTFGIARQPNYLEPVLKRRRNRVKHVGRRDKEDF